MITYASMGAPGERLVIHNLDDTDGGIFLTSFSMPMPAVREDTNDRPRSQGIDDYTEFYGARTIEMSGVAFAENLNNLATKMDQLKNAFSLFGSAQKEFVFQRLGRTYREFCKVRMAQFDCPLDVPGNMVEWSAVLVASDPRIYRRHTPDPATVSFKSNHTIVNTGTGINAPVVVRIYGPADAGCGLKNASLTVERHFNINRHIKRGSHVEIDTLARTVLLNGNRSNGILDVDSWFWKLKPGRNHLHRVGSLDGHIEVDWREARI